MSSAATEFLHQGYTVARGLFSRDEAAALLAEVKAVQCEQDAANELNSGELKFSSNLFLRSARLRAAISEQRVVDLLTPIVGPDVWVRWDQAVRKGPGSGEFPWHQDNGYTHLKRPHYQLWIALTAMTPTSGALWVAPGTQRRVLPHRSREQYKVYDGELGETVSFNVEPGDALLFSSLTLHRGSANDTAEPNWAYIVEFLPLTDFDPAISPPYFIASRGGQSHGQFVNSYPGRRNLLNHLSVKSLKVLARRIKNAALSAGRIGNS